MFKRHTAQKMKFSIKDFFSKCDQIRRKLNGKRHFLCSVRKPKVLFMKAALKHFSKLQKNVSVETNLIKYPNCRLPTLLKRGSQNLSKVF